MFAIYQMELFEVFDTLHPGLFQFGDIIFIIQAFQDLLMACFRFGVNFFKVMKNISYTHSVTAYFIGISGADTLSCSSYFRIPFCRFVCRIQNTVCRQNQMCFLGDMQSFLQIMAGSFQRFCFSFEKSRV